MKGKKRAIFLSGRSLSWSSDIFIFLDTDDNHSNFLKLLSFFKKKILFFVKDQPGK